ncbi:glycosyltransferase family 2 protein [Pelotalea chapellei]|uniref:Glycosyltransferase family 2 protein n=1 Tax=Pelotalea chapellei TaxID=44671 RepID=A0ABS5UA44_9BACT|nr:glycosyltransferase family A protein [Pelotalea chapellei]MBT1072530.1 glycosyltransferase family 2 protein [Pelotalea chapellei]
MGEPSQSDIATGPFFSVVISTYNRAKKLQRALDSLANQTFQNFEVLICDDGSTDDTAKVVSAAAERINVRHLWEPNWGGPAKPRNNGIKAAQGVWICFLDSDDWWYPAKLEKILPLTNHNDVVYHACDVYSPGGKRLRRKKSRQVTVPAFVDLMTRGNALITSSVCVRRDLLATSGGFIEDKTFIAIEDYDLWLRLALKTERFHFLSEPLGAYWADDENISGMSEKYITSELALSDKYLCRLHGTDRKEAEILLAYKIGIAKNHLKQFSDSKYYLTIGIKSHRIKIKLYSILYLILAKLRCHYPI